MAVPPAGWPPAVLGVVERSITAELATLTASGRPVTTPTTPYLGRTGGTIDVSTGLTYPAKAERARRTPRVALLFADPLGEGMATAPVVLVQGLAAVRDADLQANTDRYVASSSTKLPHATRVPRFVLRRLGWYYARIWIEVTPLRIRSWSGRDLAGPPAEWVAPAGTLSPASDPLPPGTRPRPWAATPADWQALAADALHRLPLCDLTVVGVDGFPLCVPVAAAQLAGDRIELTVGPGAPPLPRGPACLTIHGHPARFTGQENHTLVGELEGAPGEWRFRVQRAIGDWSLTGGPVGRSLGFLAKGRVLRRRLRVEAARRGQPVPAVRFPGDRGTAPLG